MPPVAARLVFAAWSACVLPLAAARANNPPVDFATEILPILSDRCAVCHGPDEASRQTSMRVDVPEVLEAQSENGGLERIIAPGDAEQSELFRRITSDDPYEQMPPPDSHLALAPEEIERIRQWIDQGASWERHWSLRPLRAPPVPDASGPPDGSSAAPNPIDRFVDRRLTEVGLEATDRQGPYDLARRLALDLTGLPPSPDQIEWFARDPSPAAYQRLIDELLAAPEHGEHMAVPWLDASRYADTYGYQADVYRDVWPWRDWVVEAFRQNMPYDQFLTWQLAGDLVPDASRQSRLATTFNRLHRQTNEGGSVEEEFRAEYVADRVNTLGTAVLGLTLECARCHDHKYDPISQRDYYRLSAFFANIDEAGLYSHFTDYVPPPVLDLPTDAQQAELDAATKAAHEALVHYRDILSRSTRDIVSDSAHAPSSVAEALLADEVARYTFGEQDATVALTSAIDEATPITLAGAPQPVPGVHGNGVALDGENGISTKVGGGWDWYQPFTISLWIRPTEHHERAVVWHRSRAWTDAASCGYELLIEDGRLSAALIHFWPGDAVRVRTAEPIEVGRWTHVSVVSDGSGAAQGLRIYVDGQEAAVEVVRDSLVRTIRGGGVDELAVGFRFRDRGFRGGQVDELRIFARDLTPLELALVADPKAMSAEAPDAPSEHLAAALAHAGSPPVRQAREELFEARQRMAAARDAIPAIMTMEEVPGLRQTFVHQRGQYDQPGDAVTPGVPAEIGPMPEEFPRNRLGLALWLTDSRPGHRHPLVARVAINRLWQMFFDQGLVATPEDFGLQGQPPSHPDLLDYLADRVVDDGWDMQRMIRLIVTSEAYQRGPQGSPETYEADPENRMLARGPSTRLPVESIRDSALVAGGLLDRTSGGPPVRPFQPEGLWEEKSSATYVRQPGAPSHRRSLYTIWKRTSPPPSMTLFDAPGREVCVAARTTTDTPLQALVLLNDEQFVEAARGAAFRMLTAADRAIPGDARERAGRLWFQILCRPGTDEEIDVLVALYQNQYQQFLDEPDSASAYLSVGDLRLPTAEERGCDDAELAAWAVAAQTLMNLHQWVTR